MTGEFLGELLLGRRYRFAHDEMRLHEEIADLLREHEVAFEREVVLAPRDRIDFLLGTIGLEVKVQGSATAVSRQLLHYAESPRVTELVLFTTRSQIVVPRSLGNKPVTRAVYRAL